MDGIVRITHKMIITKVLNEEVKKEKNYSIEVRKKSVTKKMEIKSKRKRRKSVIQKNRDGYNMPNL